MTGDMLVADDWYDDDELVDLRGLGEPEPKYEPKRVDRDLAYETCSWSRYLFRENLGDDKDLYTNVTKRYPDTEWPSFVREIFARLYGTTSKLEQPALGGEWADALHEIVSGLREWRDLEKECRGDDSLAARAAGQVSREVDLPAPPPPDPKEPADEAAAHEESAQMAEAEGDEEEAKFHRDERDKAHAEMVARLEQSQAAAGKLREPAVASRLRRSMREAVAGALGEARDTKDAVAMLSCGDGPSKEERTKWKHRIQTNKDIVKIAKLAGRMEAALEADKAMVPTDFGREEIVGVKHGNSLADAVPMERALFALDGDLEELALLQMAKLAEGRLLQNRQVGLVEEQKAGNGPIILATDESGSMCSGHPFSANIVAKAVMLTLMRKCSEEGRTFAVVHWSTTFKTSVWPKGASMNSNVLEELTTFLNGGTDMPGAIRQAVKIVKNEQPEMPKEDAERADLVLLTDAEYYEHGEVSTSLDELAKCGARLFTFHVSNDSRDHETLKKHSVHYMHVRSDAIGDGTEIALQIHRDLKKEDA